MKLTNIATYIVGFAMAYILTSTLGVTGFLICVGFAVVWTIYIIVQGKKNR